MPEGDKTFQGALTALQSGKIAEAERLSLKLLKQQPRHAGGLNVLAAALMQQRRFRDAEPYLARAMRFCSPSDATAYNLGTVLKALQRPAEALAAFDQALALNPNVAETWNNRGTALNDLGRYEEAVADFERAVRSKPGYAEAIVNKGNALVRLRRYDDALRSYDAALALNPSLEFVEGARLAAKLHVCDWNNLPTDIDRLLNGVRDGKRVATPFDLLFLPSSPDDQLRCASTYGAAQPSFPAVWQGQQYSHERIRIGYLSADFHNHATAHLMAGLFEHHDRNRFEVTALSFGPNQPSPIRDRLEGAFEHFLDVAAETDEGIAALIRHHEIDILLI